MTAQLTTNLDEGLREMTEKLHEDVIGINYHFGYDWSGDPAIFFRVLLRDHVSGPSSGKVTQRITDELMDGLQLRELEEIAYFRFRTQRDQDRLQEPEWP